MGLRSFTHTSPIKKKILAPKGESLLTKQHVHNFYTSVGSTYKNTSPEVPFSKHLALLGLYCSWGSHIIHPKAMCMSNLALGHIIKSKKEKMLFVDQRFNDSSNISPSWKALNMKILQMSLSGISWHVASVTRKKLFLWRNPFVKDSPNWIIGKGPSRRKPVHLWKPN